MFPISKSKFLYIVCGFFIFFGSFFTFTNYDLKNDVFSNFLSDEEKAKLVLYPCLNESDPEVRYQCLDRKLPELFNKYGAGIAMSSYEEYVENAGETFAAHEDAHKIGEALFKFTGEDLHKSFSLCTTAAHNGCQHAVLGEAGKKTGRPLYEMKDTVAKLCNENVEIGNKRLCFHGTGHALLVERDREIKLALADCDDFQIDDFLKRECWSGVFMENFTSIMGGGGKYLKEDDPLFPCTMSDLDKKYVSTCYIQVPIPFARRLEGFEICRTAPKQWIQDCGMGLGMRLAAQRTADSDWIIEKCRSGGNDLGIPCLRGAVIYLAIANDKEVLERYCGILTGDEKRVCRQ